MDISGAVKQKLLQFLGKQKKPELLATYLFYLEQALSLRPVVFVRDKIIFKTPEDAVRILEQDKKIWRETEIQISSEKPQVNENTKRIYICPFTGKVFADNVYANPQDAIYDWLSSCPQNMEKQGGVRIKRFLVSEDPDVIKEYAVPPKEPIIKTVFASAITGKLFHSLPPLLEDFISSYLRPMTLEEVQNQTKFQLESSFLSLLQDALVEDKIAAFIESLADDTAFHVYISQWVDTEE
ncbi:hypothetical protein CpB0684 [Chlamydia pneumoniae TW-183]|uniref:Protein CPn_0658/CP_0089/CPj0658/CpB0684 n=2 Tax=Chlamydia pneumoniae TaxID=83558 RepID=Y658_CHLPN|nr:DUF2709 domain-containing protein [Chlamydia pneumoniae]Q9Z7P6.1 RecName: Full=Protein CPn_0658/CP_0089/CPj0658/CpB0684 [Chlamydia pneumoniae]AAD18797.1 CT538 hypothetical protein [Chlamydia pneumoniae CWL029]AAF37974.1 conserved hypothetical protein [Chlamydia pneumoniae AR39]AAP98613.1 hypothetical protein CpB0684 [Chlamydia pneumoniae TW-183]ACZ32542.1 conserved hypothetical protein [Chlamydia pneumoniae LPCoLN]CRI33174.1 Protein CPn_0658/CP_0089/CPj0658/CpB0684 [Chlamydia pneumoniae]